MGVVLVTFFRCRGDMAKVDLRSGLGIRSSSTSGDDWSLVSTRVAGVGRRLRICSAASGSRCGSSSGTVNWIFRGLLSGSMAGRRPLAPRCGGREGGGTRGWGGRAPSPLRSAPAPAPARRAQLAAPGSALPALSPGDSEAADWLRTHPSQPPFLPQPGVLTPSWLRRQLRGSPPRGRASGVWPRPSRG